MLSLHRYTLLTVLGLAMSTGLVAKEYTFTATVNRSKVPQNRSFQLVFSFSGGRPQEFIAPSFNDFKVVGGPSQGVNQSWVNGSYTQSYTVTYQLKPKRIGTFKIGPATAKLGNQSYTSNDLSIRVTKPKNGGGEIYEQIAENIYMRAFASKSKIYQGEQVKVTFKLYKRLDVSNMSVGAQPKYEGFWKEDYLGTESFELKPEVINGERWQTGVLESVILFPQKSGKLIIDPFILDVKVPVKASRRSRDPFDDFFGSYKQYDYQVKSKALTIEVMPLPRKNRPSNFSGLVGNIDFSATVTTNETEINESVTLRIKAAGSGNMKLVKPWSLNFPAGIENYDPKTKESFSTKNGVSSGYREFEYLLIPRREGTYKLPEIGFSYFDVEKADYVQFSESDLLLKVGKGNGSTQYADNIPKGISKEEISLLSEDITYISQRTELQPKGYRFASSTTFWALSGSPFLLFVALLAFKRREAEANSNVEGMRRKKATKLARKRLKQAQSHMAKGEQGQFYEEISKALFGYLEDKLSLDKAQMSKENVLNALERRDVDGDLRNRLSKILDECEFARFSPSQGSNLKELYSEGVELITQLEGLLK